MRFLHTSDWHLGQNLLFHERSREHQLALDWLRQVIIDRQVEALIVSGDVFDIGNPPNYARRMYYGFLTGLLNTPCRHVVITGGNHDSPSMLDAPRELLQALNMHVVGAAPEAQQDCLLELRSQAEQLEAVVAAVPFLRDRDLRYGVAGETGSERIERIREGLHRYYREMGELASPYAQADIPVIATGHLYASGAQTAGKQDNIYIGDVENIEAGAFPEIFDYVALGHIHRGQPVGQREEVRYSGSLIPLSFSETKDDKGVVIVDFKGRKLDAIEFVEAPTFRRLKSITGDLEKVKQSLRRFHEKGERQLKPWVEVIVQSPEMIPQLDVQLRDFAGDMFLEIVKIRIEYNHYQGLKEQAAEEVDLQDMDTLDVFRKKCESYGSPPEELKELETAFLELQEWMHEKKEV
jgi:exonuclease SbcD